MYRILVVDDEPYVADKIADMISEDNNDSFEVHKLYLPSLAISFAENKKIDILITDIDMPALDGFELSEIICKRWSHCKVIMLTAYSDVKLVQKAIRQNIVDYVLKIEGEKVILNAISKAVVKLEADFRRDIIIENEEIINRKSEIYLKERLVYDIVMNNDKPDTILDNLSIDLKKSFKLILTKLKIESGDDFSEHISKLTDIELMIASNLSQHVNVESCIYKSNRILFLVQPKDVTTDLVVSGEYVNDTLLMIQEKANMDYGIFLPLIISKEYLEIDHLSAYFEKLDNLLGNRYFLSNDAFVEIGLEDEFILENGEHNKRVDFYPFEMSMLETYISNEQYKEFNDYLKKVFKRVGESSQNIKFIKNLRCSIAEMLLRNEKSKNNCSNNENSKFNILISDILNIENLNSILLLITEYTSQNEKDINDVFYGDHQKIIERIEEYISNNLNKDLSLTKIADKVHFNPSYLSRLFKRLTNKTISEFIWEIKLSKAKELMIEDNVNISEISVILGFESRAYFTRFIRRMTGKTPVDYKRFLMDRQEDNNANID